MEAPTSVPVIGFDQSYQFQSRRSFFLITILRPAVVEFFGVFFLIFGIHCSGAVLTNGGQGATITMVQPLVAVFLFIGIFSFTRPLSGGHLNPVITLISIVTKRTIPVNGLFYVFAQFSGSVLGALSVKVVTDAKIHSMFLKPTSGSGHLIFAEMMGSLIVYLAYLVLATKAKGNVAILGIGFGYAGALIAVNSATFGFLNPILNFGIAVVTGVWDKHYVYWVGTLLGGCLATLLYGIVFAPVDQLWIRPRNMPERIA